MLGRLLDFRRCFSLYSKLCKAWYPDMEYMKQFEGPVMYPDETTSRWKVPPLNPNRGYKEQVVKNMRVNFGPAHPAAHGCLRMITYLDGEVTRVAYG